MGEDSGPTCYWHMAWSGEVSFLLWQASQLLYRSLEQAIIESSSQMGTGKEGYEEDSG